MAKVEKYLLQQWPRAPGEANFAAKHKWISPNDKFLLPDNGVFSILTKVFDRGANRFGRDTIQSIKDIDSKVPARERGIGEAIENTDPRDPDRSLELKVRRRARKDYSHTTARSYAQKLLKFLSLLHMKKEDSDIPFTLVEHLPAGATAKNYIDDFQSSNAPQFKGKSADKRRKMAIAAWYAKNEAIEEGEVVSLADNPKYKNKKPKSDLNRMNAKNLKTLDFAKRMGYELPKLKAVGENLTELSHEKMKAFVKRAEMRNAGDKNEGRDVSLKRRTKSVELAKKKIAEEGIKENFYQNGIRATPQKTGVFKKLGKLTNYFDKAKSEINKGLKDQNGGTVK